MKPLVVYLQRHV